MDNLKVTLLIEFVFNIVLTISGNISDSKDCARLKIYSMKYDYY